MNQTKCTFCDNTLNILEHKNTQLKCNTCGTVYNTCQQDDTDSIGYHDDYYAKSMDILIDRDHPHYTRLKDNDQFKAIPKFNINKIYAFGCGFPKLEYMFNPNIIHIYDINTKIYKKELDRFSLKYSVDKTKLNYVTALIDIGLLNSIDFSTNDMISFVHFLEHLPSDQIIDLFNALPINVPILIYQPDAAKGRSEGQLHYHPQHIQLIPRNSLIDFLNKQYNIEVIANFEYSDDLFILFKKQRKDKL